MDHNKLPSGVYKITLKDIKKEYFVLFISNTFYRLPVNNVYLNKILCLYPKLFLKLVTYDIPSALNNSIIKLKFVSKV